MPRKAPIVEQFRYARFTPDDYQRDQALMRRVDAAPCITCAQFRAIAKKEHWTESTLLAECHSQLEEPTKTIRRILTSNPPDTVVPFTCLLQLYEKATLTPLALGGEKSCACGCGGEVRGKQKFATPACQRRAHRLHHPTQPVKSASEG